MNTSSLMDLGVDGVLLGVYLHKVHVLDNVSEDFSPTLTRLEPRDEK